MRDRVFSKILIMVIIAIVLAGGFFVWQKFGSPREEITMPRENVAGMRITFEAIFGLFNQSEAIIDLQKCDSESENCVVPIMEKYGASKEAIDFFERTHWFLTDFKEMGKVDLATISTPWRANSNDQYALVNGSPEIIYAEDEALGFSQKLIDYNRIANTFPTYSLYSSAGFMKKEGDSFLFISPINEGSCRLCYSGYMAIVSFDFEDGNYLGPRLLDFCTEEDLRADIKDERFLTCNQIRGTADWQTYKNEEYGFEIIYPRDFFFRLFGVSSEPNVFSIEFASKEWENQKVHNPSVYIMVSKTAFSPKQLLDKYGTERSIFDESLPLPKCHSELGGCRYFSVKDIKDVFVGIDKISALQFHESAASGSNDNTLIKDAKKNILIEIARHSSGMGEVSKDIYDRMLSTFRFLK